MAIKIDRLVCNVTLLSSSATGATDPTALAAGPGISRATSEPSANPEARESDASSSAAPAGASAHGEPGAPSPDPQLLADRVYRLMQEELIVARERE